ncbi:hypothetical protein AB0870_08110 [Microbacterium proteolyticum]|uniref:hypothetical protein n=1 Tax=Microbacterium proteolyticum TaxID=1572644 RepID=UPI00241684BE|nr:hypothetical protein [Microbacterium proteolyticum]
MSAPVRHKVVTYESGGGFAARCTCGDVTFGGYGSRTEARAALTHEKAPKAGQGFEGSDQIPTIERQDQIVNIIPDTDAARQAVSEWAAEYVAIAAQQETRNFVNPPEWPAAATPSWVSEVEVGAEVSGEVLILFAHEVGEVAITSSVGVIVKEGPAHPDKVVGDILPEPSGVTLRLVGEHEELRSTAAMRLFDSLATAIVLLRKIEAAA